MFFAGVLDGGAVAEGCRVEANRCRCGCFATEGLFLRMPVAFFIELRLGVGMCGGSGR